ncbi:MAG: glycerophosphodiester phosphodiesterase family protein [Pseudomonadota bacterium]
MIEIVCHRGANQLAPENTYASAELCINWGMDYLEIDVNTSRDGVMYLFHGPDLARTTNGKGKIYEWDSKDLDRLDCGSWFDASFCKEPMPRLDEFLNWVDGRIKLFFDVKWADLPALVKLVKRHNLADRCFFWFGRDRLAREFSQQFPEIPLKINVWQPADVATAVDQYHASIVELRVDAMTDAMKLSCAEAGVRSMVMHQQNEPAVFRQMIDWQPDLVNVDHANVFARLRQVQPGNITNADSARAAGPD